MPIQNDVKRKMSQIKRRQSLFENLTAYLFLLPSFIIIFTFGIFPVLFAFFISLHRWRRFPKGFRGLDNYVEALGNLAYVLFFWLALLALCYGLYRAWRIYRQINADQHHRLHTLLLPSLLSSLAIFSMINWFFKLLLVIFDIPVRLRGQQLSRDVFIGEFFNSFTFPEVTAAARIMIPLIVIALLTSNLFLYLLKVKREQFKYLTQMTLASSVMMAGMWLLNLTLLEIQVAVSAARSAGEALPIWSQIIMISLGIALLAVALWLWNRTVHDHQQTYYLPRLLAVVLAVIGGIFLMHELPLALANADSDVLQGFRVTVMYSVCSVPLQLTLGMILAVILFQKIRAKSFFRMVFFLPYITPFVATSVIFSLLFSPNENSLVNQLVSIFGIEPQIWLQQSRGVFQLIFGDALPTFLAGPSLALLVIIIYNVWIYAGYSSVIFLAGLGNISEDVYEAARIDGANAWQQFRHITIPLLSPTTFFLILISTIGTFQAFTQIFLMRRPGAFSAVDTINIYIYNEIRNESADYGYGSALAFVLFAVILILTIIQNRVAERRVFYG